MDEGLAGLGRAMITCSLLVELEHIRTYPRPVCLTEWPQLQPPAVPGSQPVGQEAGVSGPAHVGSLSGASSAGGQMQLWARCPPRCFCGQFEMSPLCPARLDIT